MAEADSAGRAAVPPEGSRDGARAMTVFLRFLFCFLVVSLGPMAWWQRHGWVVHRAIPTSLVVERDGAAHDVSIPLYPFTRRLTDSVDRGETSDLRLFAGAKQLGPGHTPPDTVATLGGGRFDDWEGAVVMSAPDNGDPRTSGLVYSASYRAYPAADAPAALAAACALAALAAAEASMLLGLRPWRRPGRWTASQARHVGLTSVLYGVAVAVAVLALHGASVRAILAPDRLDAVDGLAFRGVLADAPPLFAASSDDALGGSRSELTLTEDGRPLGPPHAPHALIRSSGRGSYSHWAGGVVFSTADGADPRTDGRSYRVTYRIFLVPAAAWSILALCIGVVVLRLLRISGSAVGAASRGAAAQGSALGAVALLRPRSLLRLGSLAVIYTLALLILYGSLVARGNDTGGFRINFEYKVF